MTLVVSIMHRKGIIMASDSQATMQRGVPVKRLNQTKLVPIDGAPFQAVIGSSGSVPLISKALEEIQDAVLEGKIKTFRDLVRTAELAVLHIGRYVNVERMLELQPPRPQIDTNQTVQFPWPDVLLLIGGVDEKSRPVLYTIYSDGVAGKEEKISAIGSGTAYAEYILSQHYFADVNEEQAIKIAVHTISEVEKIDPGVGGPIQIVTINSDKKSLKFLNDKDAQKVLEEINRYQSKVLLGWRDFLKSKSLKTL